MSEHTCSVCLTRTYERAHVCGHCRNALHHLLADIRDLWLRLPEALQAARGNQPKVSGSRNPPAPINLDAVDLAGLARPGSRAPHARGVLGLDDDQIGHLSTATDLEQIARDWREQLYANQLHLPAPDVPALIRWLDNRVEDACDRHPAMDEVDDELRSLKRALRATLSDYPPRPDLCHGVACKQCDMRALYRGETWITCGNCGLLYSEQEYHDWVKLLAAEARGVAA